MSKVLFLPQSILARGRVTTSRPVAALTKVDLLQASARERGTCAWVRRTCQRAAAEQDNPGFYAKMRRRPAQPRRAAGPPNATNRAGHPGSPPHLGGKRPRGMACPLCPPSPLMNHPSIAGSSLRPPNNTPQTVWIRLRNRRRTLGGGLAGLLRRSLLAAREAGRATAGAGPGHRLGGRLSPKGRIASMSAVASRNHA